MIINKTKIVIPRLIRYLGNLDENDLTSEVDLFLRSINFGKVSRVDHESILALTNGNIIWPNLKNKFWGDLEISHDVE
jgi:hypothetical protein